MKRAFNMFTNSAQQAIKFRRILVSLIGPFHRPRPLSRLLTYLKLPIVTDEAFVAKDVTILHSLQDHFRRIALIGIGTYQVIQHRQTIQRREHYQFFAKVVQLPRRTVSIASTPSKIAVPFPALIPKNRHPLLIHQQLFRVVYPKFAQPVTAQLLDQITQTAGAAIVLALIKEFGKFSKIIGSDI